MNCRSKRSIKASRFPGWRVYCLSSTIGQQYCERWASPVIAFSLGNGSDAWANAYRQPVAVRTYVSLQPQLVVERFPLLCAFGPKQSGNDRGISPDPDAPVGILLMLVDSEFATCLLELIGSSVSLAATRDQHEIIGQDAIQRSCIVFFNRRLKLSVQLGHDLFIVAGGCKRFVTISHKDDPNCKKSYRRSCQRCQERAPENLGNNGRSGKISHKLKF